MSKPKIIKSLFILSIILGIVLIVKGENGTKQNKLQSPRCNFSYFVNGDNYCCGIIYGMARKGHAGFVEGTPELYKGLIISASEKYGVPTNILSALLKQESNFNPNAASGAGAIGIAQIVPKWHPGVDPTDPKAAIPYAAKLIANGIKEYGSLDLALAAYNAGGGAVRQYGGIPPYPETQNYVKSILSSADTTYGSTEAFPDLPQVTPVPQRSQSYNAPKQVKGAKAYQPKIGGEMVFNETKAKKAGYTPEEIQGYLGSPVVGAPIEAQLPIKHIWNTLRQYFAQ